MTRIDASMPINVNLAVAPEMGAGSPEEAGSNLPPPVPVPAESISQAIATLLVDASFERRRQAREQRSAATVAMVGMQKTELAHMRQAAEDRHDAALAQGYSQIGAGIAGAAGAALQIGGASNVGKLFDSSKDAIAGAGTLYSGSQTKAASNEDTEAKACEYAAKALSESCNSYSDEIAEAGESAKKSIDFIREIEGTSNQARSAALHRS